MSVVCGSPLGFMKSHKTFESLGISHIDLTRFMNSVYAESVPVEYLLFLPGAPLVHVPPFDNPISECLDDSEREFCDDQKI